MRKLPTGTRVQLRCLPYKGVIGTVQYYKRWFGMKHVFVLIEGGPLFSGPRVVHVAPHCVKEVVTV